MACTAAQLLVRCLENEGIEYIFGIPGEENLAMMDALLDSSVIFHATRHEQGAAFMADVYGRLTGKAAVCLSTLGPGATNLLTGVADANMDRAPLVAITGQAGRNRLHKESHQALDLVSLFRPVTKWNAQISMPEIVPEIVRKAVKVAQEEKPGATHIDFPEDVADMMVDGIPIPIRDDAVNRPAPTLETLEEAQALIEQAERPIIMAGNGVSRARAGDALTAFVTEVNIPAATTFMGKGALSTKHPLSLCAVGLQSKDYVSAGFSQADLVICIGYDIVEYPPELWNPAGDKKILHIDMAPAEVDRAYNPDCEVVGDIAWTLKRLHLLLKPKPATRIACELRDILVAEVHAGGQDDGFPVKPQRICFDLRQAMQNEDIVISDVGAHKMWLARMYFTREPNTCLISNGFASMGIALPGAIAAQLVYPQRTVVAATGDAGFLMNVQELETAVRLKTPIVVLIWNDSAYGLIKWKQMTQYGRPSHVDFGNPDFVALAESFGARGIRINAANELGPALEQARRSTVPVVIDCPVDYAENLKLTEKLGNLEIG